MREQSKAAKRRSKDPRFQDMWFVGRGIDVGCGPDPMDKSVWPRVESVDPFDIEFGHGDASYLTSVKDEEYDFLVSSHCLEHLHNPIAAMGNWLRVVKPGGLLVVAVPDEFLYEYGQWPSRFNPDHKNSFTLRKHPIIPSSINVNWMLYKIGCDVEFLQLVVDGWSPEKLGQDQTLLDAESAIEFVVRKPR